MRILFVSSEVFPYAKTGGLADLSGSLPQALRELGHDVRVITPLYRSIQKQSPTMTPTVYRLPVPLGQSILDCQILQSQMSGGVPIYFIKYDEFYDRDELYQSESGEYLDNAPRFIYFCRAVIEGLKRIDFRPDIIHCHDWQTALIPLYLKSLYRKDRFYSCTSTLLSIHDIAHQGIFWHYDMELLGLGWEYFTVDTLEFYGKINLLKGGILFADCLTTVSSSYAQEIVTAEHGHGLEMSLRYRQDSLHGIISGIDTDVWNAEHDPLISQNFTPDDMRGKDKCRRVLLGEAGLPVKSDVPIFSVVSRLERAKGFDLVTDVFHELMEHELYLIILGKGLPIYHEFFNRMKKTFREKLGLFLVHDEDLAHRILAGSDFLLMPSRSEPGGLTQLQALRYGTLPIVRAVGGLKDTIRSIDATFKNGNGFVFEEYTGSALRESIDSALELYKKTEALQRIRRQAMKTDVSWKSSARLYCDLYRTLGKVSRDCPEKI